MNQGSAPRKKPLFRHACLVAAQGTEEAAGQRALGAPSVMFSTVDLGCCPMRAGARTAQGHM